MSNSGKALISGKEFTRVLTLGLALASAASVAVAQDEPPTGSRLGSRNRPGTVLAPADAAQAATNAARCMDFKHPTAVREYLLATNGKVSDKKVINEELECLGLGVGTSESSLSDTRQFNFPEDVMRGMLAEAEIQRSPTAFSSLQPLQLEQQYSRPWFAATTRNSVVDEMAVCLASVDPQGIAAILNTRPYTAAEGAAFASMSPRFGPCLRAGAKLLANRQAMCGAAIRMRTRRQTG